MERLGRLVDEVSSSPHDSRSIVRLAEALDSLSEQLMALEKRVAAFERASKKRSQSPV